MALLRAMSKLTLSTPGIRSITTTPALFAEPLKKKKKIDPAIIKQREERRRKKLEKQIRRLEKNARQLRPVEELEVPLELIDEKDKRARNLPPLSAAEVQQRAQLIKKWAQYKHVEKFNDFQVIDRLLAAQQKALNELRAESEDLYQAAIELDVSTVLNITLKGPVSTPPIPGYNSPDGEYIHKTKAWDVK